MATVNANPVGEKSASKSDKRRVRRPRGDYTITTIRMVEVAPNKWRPLRKKERVGGRPFYDTYELDGRTKLGERIRERSKDRSELTGRKQKLEVADANAPDERQITSHLSDDKIREAEGAFHRLDLFSQKMGRPKPYSLDSAVSHFIATYYEPQTEKTLAQLAEEFLEDLRVRRQCSKAYLRSSENDLRRWCAYPGVATRRWSGPKKAVADAPAAEVLRPDAFGNLKPHEITPERHCYPFMQAQRFKERATDGPAAHTSNTELKAIGNKRWNNLRGILRDFFSWMVDPPRRYLIRNPWDEVETRFWKTKPPIRLSVRRAAELMLDVMNYKGGKMVPYFALALFGGVRPAEEDGELDKLAAHPRLNELINFGTKTIYIDETVAKGGRPRPVVMQPALSAWLRAFPVKDFPIMPTNARAMLDEIRSRHALEHDVMRHSFISFHAGKFRSAGSAALDAGNGESVTRKRYLNLPTERESDLFWRITPQMLRDPEKRKAFFIDVYLFEQTAKSGLELRVMTDEEAAEHERFLASMEPTGPVEFTVEKKVGSVTFRY